MTWLSEHKKRFDAEEADKAEKERKAIEEEVSRQCSAYRELVRFVETALHDLVGKKTKDGKTLRLELKDRSCATVYAGDEKFLYLHFWYKEGEKYDRDGCSWGDGTYSLCRQVTYCRPHKSRHGYDEAADKWGSLYDEDLAYYLLTFLE
jgi:hypothetical protein